MSRVIPISMALSIHNERCSIALSNGFLIGVYYTCDLQQRISDWSIFIDLPICQIPNTRVSGKQTGQCYVCNTYVKTMFKWQKTYIVESFLRAGMCAYSLKSYKLIFAHRITLFSLLWRNLSETVKWINIFYVTVYSVPYVECRMS